MHHGKAMSPKPWNKDLERLDRSYRLFGACRCRVIGGRVMARVLHSSNFGR